MDKEKIEFFLKKISAFLLIILGIICIENGGILLSSLLLILGIKALRPKTKNLVANKKLNIKDLVFSFSRIDRKNLINFGIGLVIGLVILFCFLNIILRLNFEEGFIAFLFSLKYFIYIEFLGFLLILGIIYLFYRNIFLGFGLITPYIFFFICMIIKFK